MCVCVERASERASERAREREREREREGRGTHQLLSVYPEEHDARGDLAGWARLARRLSALAAWWGGK
jgi:hypothetical protein